MDMRPYIGLEHIQQQTLRLLSIGKSTDVVSGKYVFKSGDILFGKLRPYFRKVVRPKFEGVCSTDIFVIRSKNGVDQGFLYYLMASEEMVAVASKASEGTKMPRASWNYLQNVDISLPHLPEQRRIASILSAFDDKIELNNQMNRTLEEMASAIFKSWFVDFKPFLEGEFEYNEERDKEIPKGWEVGRLEDLVTISTKSIKPFEKPHTLYRHFSIPAFDEGRIPTLEKGVDIKSNKHVIEKDCVLVSKLNPRFPRVWRPSVVNDMTSICSTEFIVYEGKREGWTDFLYWLFKSQSFSDLMLSHVTGTTGSRQRVKPNDTLSFRIITPPDNIIGEFVKAISVISKQVQMNLEESQNLAQIRDALLPKLLSGEIRVNSGNNNMFKEAEDMGQ